MVVRVFLGALVSAALLFVWGFLFWGVLPASDRLMDQLPAEGDVIAAFREAGLGTGMYIYPTPVDIRDEQAVVIHEAQHLAGPVLQLSYRAEGGQSMPPQQYINGLTHFFAVALIAGCLLAMARSALPAYRQRVGFVLLLGLLATVWTHWADAIWWFHPWVYVIGLTVYMLISALILGITLAAFIQPETAATN